MNNLPPILNPPPLQAISQKPPLTTSGSASQHRFLLGLIAGVVLGIILASLLWVPIGLLLLRSASVGSPTVPVETRVSPVEPVEAGEEADKAARAEIDAASQLSFENSKLGLYSQIAARPNLGPDAQAHLIEVACQQLSFENNRLQVLLKLIANPSFSPPAKQAILKNLGSLSFENNKQAILEAINRRESQR